MRFPERRRGGFIFTDHWKELDLQPGRPWPDERDGNRFRARDKADALQLILFDVDVRGFDGQLVRFGGLEIELQEPELGIVCVARDAIEAGPASPTQHALARLVLEQAPHLYPLVHFPVINPEFK